MSIKRVIFTSGPNVKPLFLRQYLAFFNKLHFDHYFNPKIQILKKIANLKVYGNLKATDENKEYGLT